MFALDHDTDIEESQNVNGGVSIRKYLQIHFNKKKRVHTKSISMFYVQFALSHLSYKRLNLFKPMNLNWEWFLK